MVNGKEAGQLASFYSDDMPIDYSKYPENWLSEIRPRIMARAQDKCERCGLKHLEIVWAVKCKGRTVGWFRDFDEAERMPKTFELKKYEGKLMIVPNPKKVKVILTIAHLDHDEGNHAVSDDRLKAMCQLCHLRYDAKEKYRRQVAKG